MASKSKKQLSPVLIYAIVAAVLIAGILAYTKTAEEKQEEYSVSEDGIIQYNNRPELKIVEESVISDNPKFVSKKVVFESHGAKIYGLYVRPKVQGSNKIPAAVVLPGGSVKKEEMGQFPNDLNDLGIATLVIDQRGIGETAGVFPPLEEDYLLFKNGQEPYHHKMAYDALRAFDYLGMQKDIDQTKILVTGESMGGRNAIIAAAIEPKVFGAIVIGASGFEIDESQVTSNEALLFLKSINPDNYVGKISPRKLVMLHNLGDSIVPLEAAKATFEKAREPKLFIEHDSNAHGYRAEMKTKLEEALRDWV